MPLYQLKENSIALISLRLIKDVVVNCKSEDIIEGMVIVDVFYS